MSTGSVPALFAAQVAEATALVAALSREMPGHIRREIAPHLPEGDRDRVLGLAQALDGGSWCRDEVASRLAVGLDCIDQAVEQGSRYVERRPDGRLIAGRDVPILERRLTPEAEALRRAAFPLRELLRQIARIRDLGEAIHGAARLLRD